MGEKRFVLAGSFIDGSGNDVRRNVFLAVKNGIISAIGSATDLACNDAGIDDFSHCTILPALVDCSVALSRSPAVDQRMRMAEKSALAAKHIHYCHSYGVQGVAESDDITGLMKHLQKEMAQGSLIDIRTPVRLCRTGQNCTAGDPAEGDFFKIGYSGNIEDENAPTPRLDHEDLCRMLQLKGEKKAVVVANGRQQVEEALKAGCDAVEQGYGMGADNLEKMAKMGALWIPSVLRAKNALVNAGCGGDVCCRFSQRYVAPGKADPRAEAFWKKIFAEQIAQLRLAKKLGVSTAIGTGAGNAGLLHGESMVEEMKLFIKAGYSLEETIRCASENGARFFGMKDLGMLTAGRKATFLITRGTVQQLPRKLSYLEGIYVDGKPSAKYNKNPVITV